MKLMDVQLKDLQIKTLGKCNYPHFAKKEIHQNINFVQDNNRIVFHTHENEIKYFLNKKQPLPTLELSGPRQKLFFNPRKTRIGIVTCGGLCPGLNAIIRAIVYTAANYYGIKDIYGFRNGYQGLNPALKLKPLKLTTDLVDYIINMGGTILGTSRGPQDTKVMVDYLIQQKIDILYAVGGDGTQRGALDIAQEITKRKLKISVIGIPKTIDNDIMFIERSFGFETAVQEAKKVIRSAHTEAKAAPVGVGLVKLMGRESGFIAAHASIAAPMVNFCFIPEVDFRLKGPNGFLKYLETRLKQSQHAVIVVAEGAGQQLIADEINSTDASGNKKLKDIGTFLKTKIEDHFHEKQLPITVKYIDPSYIIRSVGPTADDSAFCLMLGQNAVHAGMAGKTEMVVGFRNDHYVHIPSKLVTSGRKKINPDGRLWNTVLETTGQPVKML